jgi:putative ABC transport system substrate-binding protein
MRRRDFIWLLGGAAAWPLAARGQQVMPVIGYLQQGSSDDPFMQAEIASFRRGLGDVGYVEGRNVIIEPRWADGRYDRLPGFAADFVHRQVKVIMASGTPAALAAKAATTAIPIVFTTGGDPVQLGLAASLARPGGNLTGATTMIWEIAPKQIELVHELVPSAKTIAALFNDANPTNAERAIAELKSASRTLGLQLHVVYASTDRALDAVFDALAQIGAGALLVGNDTFLISRSPQLAELTTRHMIPTIFNRDFAVAGGLLGYGANRHDVRRLLGTYAGRIINGEKPADLPVQQSAKIELIINMKTAKVLGLTVPITLLGRADEVIE